MEICNKIIENVSGNLSTIYFTINEEEDEINYIVKYCNYLFKLLIGLHTASTSNLNFYFTNLSLFPFETFFDIVCKEYKQPRDYITLQNFDYPMDRLLTELDWFSNVAYTLFGNLKPILKDVVNRSMRLCNWDNFNVHVAIYLNENCVKEKIDKIIKKHPYDTVLLYIFSDDVEKCKQFKMSYKKHRVKVVYEDNTAISEYEKGLILSKNLILFGHCDYVIGDTSKFCVLGGLLSIFNNKDKNRFQVL